MSILSLMMVITAMVAGFMLARFAVYHLLVWLKPSKTLKLTYVDQSGVQHFREVSLESQDARLLVKTLNEIQSNAKRDGE
ncbi:hypothetical protein [Mixta intestinalis]|uniref:Uncharacterized protein n=1 Tax=Mixta intestinalis TaxID=1615494 RepID=A0A6P1PZL8_9GAMM|nr:hypothetical protein [Mixta intestinalis]QHM71309.1 hypothetical protein C7M51_01595 [Mixta intestinalis]